MGVTARRNRIRTVFAGAALSAAVPAVTWWVTTTLTATAWIQALAFGLSGLVVAGLTAFLIVRITPELTGALRRSRRLAQLDSLAHPLLLRLSQEAPGTFHHSLQVGALAAAAAAAIGADSQLARLGGYYHDIGKLAHPGNFIENQSGGVNPLDKVGHRKAAQAIIEHVDDGLELARSYHLPASIIAFIPQHVGTTQVQYFLRQAEQSGKRFDPELYQYPGPKPQRIEAAIVMLADAIEAKARLVTHPTRQILTELVAQTMHEKNHDGQFEFILMSPSDRSAIHHAFVAALEPIHHRRIAYPTRSLSEKGRV